MNAFYLSLICSLVISVIAIPTIIRISYLKHLYDVPDDRKSHTRVIPTLGGLAIFAGFVISLCAFGVGEKSFQFYQYLLSGCFIIFFIGVQDDILIISPLKKLFGQIIAATIIVVLGGLKISGLYGLFGIYEIPDSYSSVLTIFTLLVIMNGFNLIDGINWLSGGVGNIVSLTFGVFFIINAKYELAVISSSLAGGLLGFMWFNKTPAKIFMGDTGSLLLGLINGFLAIHFIEMNGTDIPYRLESAPIVAFGIMIVPLFDTLRVFIWRMLRGKSPLNPDRNHIHHRLLEIGLGHLQASGIIMFANVFFIVLCILLHEKINSLVLLVLMLITATVLSYIPSIIAKKQKKELRQKEAALLKKNRPTPLSKVS